MKTRLCETRSSSRRPLHGRRPRENNNRAAQESVEGAGCRKNIGYRVQGEKFLLTSPFIERLKSCPDTDPCPIRFFTPSPGRRETAKRWVRVSCSLAYL